VTELSPAVAPVEPDFSCERWTLRMAGSSESNFSSVFSMTRKSRSAVRRTTAFPSPTTFSSMEVMRLVRSFSTFFLYSIWEFDSCASSPPSVTFERTFPLESTIITSRGLIPSMELDTRCAMPWICGSLKLRPFLSLTMTEAVGFFWSSENRDFFGITRWTRLCCISSRLLIVRVSSPWRARW
jgi:hypothetical protein